MLAFSDITLMVQGEAEVRWEEKFPKDCCERMITRRYTIQHRKNIAQYIHAAITLWGTGSTIHRKFLSFSENHLRNEVSDLTLSF